MDRNFIFGILLFLLPLTSIAQVLNGFDLKGASIPTDEIFRGGPPRDGIPSIDKPAFNKADNTTITDDSRILGVYINGVAKAYPINIMNYHEIVNDIFGEDAVVITYCPLCGSGVAYQGNVAGKDRTFGVSGLLYNSDVLLYDRESESLWSQMMSEAVTGQLKGEKLTIIPTSNTTWREWKSRFPDSQILSEKTGFQRDYSRTPYFGYDKSEQIYFPVSRNSTDYHPKELVIGIEVDGKYKVYPFSELAKSEAVVKDTFNGMEISVIFDKKNNSARVLNSNNEEFQSVTSFWFAWFAFHPKTKVFKAGK